MPLNQPGPLEYTRTLDKAYRFFQEGHVHSVMFHPLPLQPNYVLVRAKVFPSLKKTSVHHVFVVLKESAARVAVAYCACPAGLSGCCNHVTALLYTLEDYVRHGLKGRMKKQGCTERLILWNRPRKKYQCPTY